MVKLSWSTYNEEAWTEEGVDAKVAEAHHGKYDIKVYPTKLLNKKEKGYEYTITSETGEGDYDSWRESSNGNDHAATLAEGKKWASTTFEEYLAEERKKLAEA